MMKVKDLLGYYLPTTVLIYDDEEECGESIETEKAKEKYGDYDVLTFDAHDTQKVCVYVFGGKKHE